MSSRIEFFKQMLESDGANVTVLFGLANEYLKAENYTEAIQTLESYLACADDEGAAWGMLAKAYEKRVIAKSQNAYQRGIEVANEHGHPSMAADFAETLEFDYAD